MIHKIYETLKALMDKYHLILEVWQAPQILEQAEQSVLQYQKAAHYHLKSYKEAESELNDCKIQLASALKTLEIKEEKIERLKKELDIMAEKPVYTIDMPEFPVDDLKKALKLADQYTMETISQYIKIDTYELVKNLAKIMNSSNAAEVIAYRDGALRSNEVIIKVLTESIKSKTFVNRISGETQTVKNANKS